MTELKLEIVPFHPLDNGNSVGSVQFGDDGLSILSTPFGTEIAAVGPDGLKSEPLPISAGPDDLEEVLDFVSRSLKSGATTREVLDFFQQQK